MEYYILKLYQSAKEKNPNVEQGFNRFKPKVKVIVILCLSTMFLSSIGIIVTMILFPRMVLYLIEMFAFIMALFILFMIDSRDKKNNMDQYVDSHKQKINILGDMLYSEFQINTREKVEELMNLYQIYIDKRNAEEKARKKIILSILSAFAGILSISFTNMEIIGLNFVNWLALAIILLLIVACTWIWLYSYTFFDTLKKKYEMVIKDLQDLLLVRY